MTACGPATRPTMYFIGLTAGQSSIMQVFAAWMRALGIDAVIKGYVKIIVARNGQPEFIDNPRWKV